MERGGRRRKAAWRERCLGAGWGRLAVGQQQDAGRCGSGAARRGAALRAPAQLQLPRVQLLRYIQPSVTAPNTVPTRQRLTEPLLSPVLPLIGTSEQPVP